MTSNVWFTSDPHFGHRLVAGIRGFDSTDDHDAAILDGIASDVRPGDQVWWLGDLTAGSPTKVFEHFPSMPGEHHLVAGNHDRCSPIFRDAHKWQRKFLDSGFASVQAYARRRVGGESVLLSHYPYATSDGEADRGEIRYAQYRLPDEGLWLLHGHTHMADQRVHGRQIHVGMDAWSLRLVNLDEVAAIIREGSK